MVSLLLRNLFFTILQPGLVTAHTLAFAPGLGHIFIAGNMVLDAFYGTNCGGFRFNGIDDMRLAFSF